MGLTNAERQARYRQRLKDAARQGVTQDDVVRAVRLAFEEARRDDPSLPYVDWDDFTAKMAKRPKLWAQWLPADPDDEYSEFGEDAELMQSVARVVRAVLYPPGWRPRP